MGDPLASSLFDAVLESRRAVRGAEERVVAARTAVWTAARSAGVAVAPLRYGDSPPGIKDLVRFVADRVDPAAEAVREADTELEAAESAASAAHDVAAAVRRQFHASLPATERDAHTGECLLGGRNGVLHRFHVLVAPTGRAIRTAEAAMCGQPRGMLWRAAGEAPRRNRLCEACQVADGLSAPSRGHEVPRVASWWPERIRPSAGR